MIMLPIAMPKDCGDCPCMQGDDGEIYGKYWRAVNDKDLDFPRDTPRPGWCSIIEMQLERRWYIPEQKPKQESKE